MDKLALLGLLQKPENLTEDHLEELEEVVQKYPYFHVPHVLVARLLQEKNSSLALQKIRKASLYVYNRALLKKFVLNGHSTQNIDAMEEHNNKEEESNHRDLFTEIKQEIEDFDKKIENASIEELDKELANITESYLPKNYLVDETNKTTEENPDKTENQKEQDFLIDEFLKADIYKKKTSDEEISKETEEDTVNPIQENPEIAIEIVENKEVKEATETLENKEIKETVETPETLNISTPSMEISEEDALKLFNEGNTKGAVEMYEKLKEKFPEKAAYFQSQIDIFKMDFTTIQIPETDLGTFLKNEKEAEVQPETTENKETIIPQTETIENMVQPILEEKKEEPIIVETKEETLKTQENTSQTGEEVTEQQALMFFNEGNISKAVEIYKQLMLQNPDKKAYFASQIEILES